MSSDRIYHDHGIYFEYPDGWELSEQGDSEHDLTVTLSDGAAFWALTLMWERPQVDRVLREAYAAFVDEYEEIEVADAKLKISNRDALGLDIQFVCLELVNSVHLRCVRTGRFTAFLMSQMTDHEQKYYRPIFDEITGSLDLDRDGEIVIS